MCRVSDIVIRERWVMGVTRARVFFDRELGGRGVKKGASGGRLRLRYALSSTLYMTTRA